MNAFFTDHNVRFVSTRRQAMAAAAVALALRRPSVGAAAGLAPAPWPMFGHDPQHTGRASVRGPGQPAVAWTFYAVAGLSASPVVGPDGTIYLASEDRTLRALSPAGGLYPVKWTYTARGRVLTSPAIADDGTLYFGAADGRLYALFADGVERWTFAADGQVRAAPVIAPDGTILYGTDGGLLLALSPAGEERFRHTAQAPVQSAPALSPARLIHWAAGQDVYAGGLDGGLAWRKTLDGPVTSSPTVGADGTVYVGTDAGGFFALDGGSGATKWRAATGGIVRGTAALATDGTAYVGSDDGKLYAVGPDGGIRWTQQTGAAVTAQPAVDSAGTIYAGSRDSTLYVLSPDGRLLSTFRTFAGIAHGAVVGAEGSLYLVAEDLRFYALKEGGRVFDESPPDRLGGTLPRDPATGRIYVLVDGQRRHVPDPETFDTLHLSRAAVVSATALELARWPLGEPLPTVPEGSLARSPHGPLYVVRDRRRQWIPSLAAFAAGGYAWENVRTVEDRVMRSIPLPLAEGLLAKGVGEQVYVVEGGQRRWITSPQAFAARGYTWDQVHFVAEAALDALPRGSPIE